MNVPKPRKWEWKINDYPWPKFGHKQYWNHKNNPIFLAHLNLLWTFFFLVCKCQSLHQRSYSPDMNINNFNIKSIMLSLLWSKSRWTLKIKYHDLWNKKTVAVDSPNLKMLSYVQKEDIYRKIGTEYTQEVYNLLLAVRDMKFSPSADFRHQTLFG